MCELKNSTALATERSTVLARAIESLSNSGQINKDGQMTVVGNSNEHSAIGVAQRTEGDERISNGRITE